MKKKLLVYLLGIMLLITAFPTPAKADHGPKPSTTVYFENVGDTKAYATILSPYEHSTMWSAFDGTDYSAAPKDDEALYAVWEAFVNYKDSDHYFFLQRIWDVHDLVSWSYHAPENFKVLLYFPETNTFAVSEKLAKKNLETVLSVDISQVVSSGKISIKDISLAPKALKNNILGFFSRAIFTIVVELLLALLFKLREKRMLGFILIVNVITQIILNAFLETFVIINGAGYSFFPIYILSELVVCITETVLYLIYLKKISTKPVSSGRIVLYTVMANVVTFIGGFYLSLLTTMT